MHKSLATAVLFLATTGCASTYDARSAKTSAEFNIKGINDSSSTIARNTFGWAFEDERCGENRYGTQLGGRYGNDAILESPVIKIGADEPFFFTAVYVDGRMGQMRQCNVSAHFLPKPGHRYQATLLSGGNVASCKVGIFDVTQNTPERVEFSMPAQACILGGSPTQNGEPIWTNIQVR